MSNPNSPDQGDGNGASGARTADALSRIGNVYSVPSSTGERPVSGGGSYFSRLFESIMESAGGGPAGGSPSASSGDYAPQDSAIKLPPRRGNASADWKTETPIPARPTSTGEGTSCPSGLVDYGVVLFVHDVETRFWEYARHSDADRWMAVHTVADMIQGLRDLVGTCGYVRGIMVDAHGGYAGTGGWRFGDDTDGDGHLEPNEATSANDVVSGASDARAFGDIIKGAYRTSDANAFFSIASCGATGNTNSFITELHNATNLITLGSVDTTSTGYSWWSGSWWNVSSSGRAQINRDGSTSTSSTRSGTGIWRPF